MGFEPTTSLLACVNGNEMEAPYQKTIPLTQVPTMWCNAHPQKAPLDSWVDGLQHRLQHIKRWLLRGLPRCLWLPSLLCPASFLVALLHESARRQQIPAEQLTLHIQPTDMSCADDVTEVCFCGAALHGSNARVLKQQQRWNWIICMGLGNSHFDAVKMWDAIQATFTCAVC
jgi:hypothetical protein